MNLEERARQIFAKGNCSIKEAFDMAKLEMSGDIPEGFAEIFNLARNNK